MTGDALYEAALKLIDRHHYEIFYIIPRRGKGPHIEFMKRDCRLQALVPLTDVSHGKIRGEALKWEGRFREAKEAVMRGKLYIPSWWEVEDRIAFAQDLRREGWRPFAHYR